MKKMYGSNPQGIGGAVTNAYRKIVQGARDLVHPPSPQSLGEEIGRQLENLTSTYSQLGRQVSELTNTAQAAELVFDLRENGASPDEIRQGLQGQYDVTIVSTLAEMPMDQLGYQIVVDLPIKQQQAESQCVSVASRIATLNKEISRLEQLTLGLVLSTP